MDKCFLVAAEDITNFLQFIREKFPDKQASKSSFNSALARLVRAFTMERLEADCFSGEMLLARSAAFGCLLF